MQQANFSEPNESCPYQDFEDQVVGKEVQDANGASCGIVCAIREAANHDPLLECERSTFWGVTRKQLISPDYIIDIDEPILRLTVSRAKIRPKANPLRPFTEENGDFYDVNQAQPGNSYPYFIL